MMQIERLVLYSKSGETRDLEFVPGRLNVITGDSQTGKSSLVNIIRYCLGASRANVPVGAISQTVGWYVLVVRIGDSRLLLGRPAGDGNSEVSAALLVIQPDGLPIAEDLEPNTTATELREYVARAIGIEENLHVPDPGQTRRALAAGLKHSLYYCFQGQGEIANPEVLFHRQNRDFQAQAIRDTMPYFLGTQGTEEVRLRQELTRRRRDLRSVQQRLAQARAERETGRDRAESLLREAHDAGLLEGPQVDNASAPDEGATDLARSALRDLVDRALPHVVTDEYGAAFDEAQVERARLRERARDIAGELRGLDEFARVSDAYGDELDEHEVRLAAIGLIPAESHDSDCPVCGQGLSTSEADESEGLVADRLASTSRRLELADRDKPRVERARSSLLQERDEVLRQLQDVDDWLESLATTHEELARQQELFNLQSYVRGKIAQYLDDVVAIDDPEFDELSDREAALVAAVEQIEAALDPETLRSRLDSALAQVSRKITQLARDLGLEHAESGVRLDHSKLTIVADTQEGPAFLDAGNIGSGLNWVGYHLSTYLGLHEYFIENERPVPRFILFDQPSQAFFPSDVPGHFQDLSDSDRENTKKLYRLMFDVVAEQEGDLQLIAIDHADFEDRWFQESVVEHWRGDEALIPRSWIDGDE